MVQWYYLANPVKAMQSNKAFEAMCVVTSLSKSLSSACPFMAAVMLFIIPTQHSPHLKKFVIIVINCGCDMVKWPLVEPKPTKFSKAYTKSAARTWRPIDAIMPQFFLKKAPFWNELFLYGHYPKGRGGRGVKACQDGLEHFFSKLAWLTEGGGTKAILAMPI